MAIYFTSDLHLFHNREFLYKPRGCESIDEMNKKLYENWIKTVEENDDVYVLGDLMLNDNKAAIEIIKSLPGKIHIILGNHDTDARIHLYKSLPNVVEICYSKPLKYGNFKFYLSHYQTITTNIGEYRLRDRVICLHGHTHQKTNFTNDNPWMYHVGLDSHNMELVSIEQIISDIIDKYNECLEML